MSASKFSIRDLAIFRQDNKPVANRFFQQTEQTNSLGIILPGLRYTCDKPLLHYATQVLLSHNTDVIRFGLITQTWILIDLAS
jgi:hypothetical protein